MSNPKQHDPSAAPEGAAEGDRSAEFEAGELEAELVDAEVVDESGDRA